MCVSVNGLKAMMALCAFSYVRMFVCKLYIRMYVCSVYVCMYVCSTYIYMYHVCMYIRTHVCVL